jgi:hypothetical protein
MMQAPPAAFRKGERIRRSLVYPCDTLDLTESEALRLRSGSQTPAEPASSFPPGSKFGW